MNIFYLDKIYKGTNIQYNSDGGSQGYVIFNNMNDFAFVDNILVDTIDYKITAKLFVNVKSQQNFL